ncbi:GNAT family N-acetyltransferase [Celerinatantimonas yamalensis]|uniref:GNAT family N-acetyltransferase n=1 Tax=Celerinatantimonas yamalensis TaxID=559956 RepID=A0ABW9G7H4_9GAMM
MSVVTIRNVESTDAPALKAIYECPSVYANTLNLPYPTDTFWEKRLQAAPDNLYSYVASKDDVAVGHSVVMIEHNVRRRHVGAICIAVHERYHYQGIGHTLLTAVIDVADHWLNLKRLELSVYQDNQSAIHLYQKFGFVIEGESPAFAFRDGEYISAYSMGRVI